MNPPRPPLVLSDDDVHSFQEHGFLRVKDAFPPSLAERWQEEIWNEIGGDHGIRADDRRTWRRLPHNPRRAKQSELNRELDDSRFPSIISDLLGREDWKRPATWGGFNVFFPDANPPGWDVPTEIWHWDGPPTGDGLLIFSFYGEVRPSGGGTLIVDRSHQLVQKYYDSLSETERAKRHRFHRLQLTRWHPWLEALTGQSAEPIENRREFFMDQVTDVHGVPVQVLELHGEPGDAVFCNLGILHCVAPNTSDQPRFMRVKFLFLD